VPDPPASEPDVCVIAPAVSPDGAGRAVARVPLSRPTIFVREPLAEVRLEQQGRRLWSSQAGAAGPIHGPIAWPLPPLGPQHSLLLRLRPQGAAADAFATIELQSADAGTLARGDALLQGLGKDPLAWQRSIRAQLERGDLALATALLFAFEGPSDPELDALRRSVFQQGCTPSGQ
jgi:hypothetical protein